MTASEPVPADGGRPKILFLHLSNQAQFEFLGKWLVGQGWDVTYIHSGDVFDKTENGIRTRWFKPWELAIPNKGDFRHILDYAAMNCRGATELMYRMRYEEGYIPDVVMAHVGWGIGLCVKDVWPESKYIAYHEWYYTKRNWEKDKDEAPRTHQAMVSDRMRNLPIAGEFDLADANWSPTAFQASRFPPLLRQYVTVISDGVDCTQHAPDPEARIDFDWASIPKDRHIVTYATRGMEPLRGFPQFLRGLEELQKQRQDFDAVIVANNSVSYGDPLPQGDSWWLRMIDDLDLDHRRIHVNAMLPREEYTRILQASSAHVYFTEPFVTSWSLSESLAMGCLIIGSNTAPVTELVEDMENGIIVDMDDPEEIAEMISWAFDHPEEAARIRERARQFILDNHDAARIFPAKEAILRKMIGK
ncbi:MAG: glycosyltransferase [Paracoccus sp. (in: a-proteobacteria)]